MAEQKLGDLSVSWLTKFLRDQLERFPIDFLSKLLVDELVAVKKLTVTDQVEFSKFTTFRFVSTTGNPAFTNSWVNFGAPYSNAGFMLRPDGWVELVGVIKLGVVGSIAFTLPPGYRPVSTKTLATLSNGVFGRVDIGADGTVTPLAPSNNASVVLDGLHFKLK